MYGGKELDVFAKSMDGASFQSSIFLDSQETRVCQKVWLRLDLGKSCFRTCWYVLIHRHSDERLLQVAKAFAGVFIGADKGKLRQVPAPESVIHLKV